MLPYQLYDYKCGFCFIKQYNLRFNSLSIELTPKLEAESSFIRKKNADKLIDKCVRLKFKYKEIQILQRKKGTCNF